MVGNDIVDFEEAKKGSNWQHPRFLDKLFTSEEQLLIRNSEDSFLMVWRLWSMKEASYKLYTQLFPSRFYNPKGFECSIDNKNGLVKFKDFRCHTKTHIKANYVLSEARLINSKTTSKVIKFKVGINLKNKSELIRNDLLRKVSKEQELSIGDLKFQKSEFGIPTIHFNTKTIHLSISHHGRFGAYTI